VPGRRGEVDGLINNAAIIQPFVTIEDLEVEADGPRRDARHRRGVDHCSAPGRQGAGEEHREPSFAVTAAA
jgi:hypothetical protein